LLPALLKKLIEIDIEYGTFLNVNFPNAVVPTRSKGTVVTHQGKLLHGLFHGRAQRTGEGIPYFWIRFGRSPVEAPDASDITALRDNRISSR
jgi:5'-nucleotidase